MVRLTVSEPEELEQKNCVSAGSGQAAGVQQIEAPQLHPPALHERRRGLHRLVNFLPIRGHGGQQSGLQRGEILCRHGLGQPSRS
jgi:hypothetical protein